MRFPFHFRPVPFIAALILALVGIALGNWQQGRAAYKLAVQEKLAGLATEAPVALGSKLRPVAGLEYRHVSVTGEFVAAWPLFLANRPMAGRPGYYLVMPFKIAGSNTHVLVMRGWLPREAEYGRLPAFDTPTGTVTIEGIVVASAGKVLDLGEAAPLAPKVMVQNIDPQGVAKATGLVLQPFFLQQTGPDEPGEVDGMLLRVWPSPSSGIDKHRGYAFQWYALAAMAILFFVITGFRSGARSEATSGARSGATSGTTSGTTSGITSGTTSGAKQADAGKPEAKTSDAGN